MDARYFVRSVKDPDHDVVKGYPDAMPELPLTDAEIQDVIAWVKTLR